MKEDQKVLLGEIGLTYKFSYVIIGYIYGKFHTYFSSCRILHNNFVVRYIAVKIGISVWLRTMTSVIQPISTGFFLVKERKFYYTTDNFLLSCSLSVWVICCYNFHHYDEFVHLNVT